MFQSLYVPSNSNSNLSSIESSFSLSEACRWEQFSLTMAGRCTFSYLASKISTTCFVVLQVLIGSWVRQVLCLSLSALVMLDLSCRLAMSLMGKRISSIYIVSSLKSNTTPQSCNVCLPIMRSYIGAWSPGPYSSIFSWRQTFLLVEYSTKEISMSPTISVMKVPLEVPHEWGITCFATEMLLLDPFSIKRKSLLDPESSRTLIVLFLTFFHSQRLDQAFWHNLGMFFCNSALG